ncbi:MAG: hypothetical protein JNL47_03000, partial [Bacteroidia bacterium]|nr:hypothetical protein [Bacteroidia bacterium]
MRKFIYISSFIINPIYISPSLCQNIINPYNDHLGAPSSYPVLNAPAGNNLYSLHPAHIDNLIGGWSGEYEIAMKDHFWHRDADIRNNHAVSVIIESASFPFLPPCAANTNGCADDPNNPPPVPTQRTLVMPWSAYDANNHTWLTYLKNRTEVIPMDAGGDGQTQLHQTLVSNVFTKGGPVLAPGISRRILPHSALKHTVRLHCGNSINYPVISSFTFYYDLTRGRTRWYPFRTDNYTSGALEHDLMMRPVLHIRPNYPGSGITDVETLYDDASNDDWYIGGTLPYFPCDEIPVAACSHFKSDFPVNHCSSTLPVFAKEDQQKDRLYEYVYPGPFTLISAILFGPDKADVLAGYIYDDQNSQFIYRGAGPNNGSLTLKHQYYIDQNIDMTDINPDEKVIYNPSEVHITADNLIFPSYYTFKTIRGVYPTEAEVLADYTPENGCWNISDLRQVPVRTDLRTDVAGYPNNPAVEDHSVFASIYYLEPGSKLTIAECAKIFDAYFEVKQGASLIFNDHSQVVGMEDKSSNSGRYKIKCEGGAVLRNNADVQYVQNGIITQTNPLNYIARQTIEAGHAVDPNTDQPQGNF